MPVLRKAGGVLKLNYYWFKDSESPLLPTQEFPKSLVLVQNFRNPVRVGHFSTDVFIKFPVAFENLLMWGVLAVFKNSFMTALAPFRYFRVFQRNIPNFLIYLKNRFSRKY
jgi:hypothetical protein